MDITGAMVTVNGIGALGIANQQGSQDNVRITYIYCVCLKISSNFIYHISFQKIIKNFFIPSFHETTATTTPFRRRPTTATVTTTAKPTTPWLWRTTPWYRRTTSWYRRTTPWYRRTTPWYRRTTPWYRRTTPWLWPTTWFRPTTVAEGILDIL